MTRIAIILLLIGAAAFYMYRNADSNHADESLDVTPSEQVQYVKCTAKDGSIYYGEVPAGVICAKSEVLNIAMHSSPAPQQPTRQPQKNTGFKCDGRKYCSQMTSCAEATFFYDHCPDVKMSGDGDNIPCEKQWCH